MIIRTPFKLILVIAASFTFNLGLTSSLSAQTSSEVSIVNAAKALGITPKLVEVPTAKQNTSSHNSNPQIHQSKQRQVNLRRQALQKQKSDPYAAKRQQILRQNAERRQAHHQRLANIQRQKQQKARAQATQQQNGHRNVWNRVYQGFQFRDHSRRPIVQRYSKQFSKSPKRIQRLADRSADYLYMVVNELNRRRMPTELALLPFVESAYKNNAYSHAGAAGMWQFIPATGRHYGLMQTRSFDARLDSHQATRAAFDYLQKLHREFKGDWFLALAAYNAGEYRVQKEINKNRRRGKRTDYWSLDLPKETRQYVPRLLAFKEIFRNPRAYNVRLRGIPNSPALARIHVNKAVDLRKAAAYAGVPAKKLLAMNSGYLHGITTPRFSKHK